MGEGAPARWAGKVGLGEVGGEQTADIFQLVFDFVVDLFGELIQYDQRIDRGILAGGGANALG